LTGKLRSSTAKHLQREPIVFVILWSPGVSRVVCWSDLNAVWLCYDCGMNTFHIYARAETHPCVHSF
jgi:hypothetical protein